MAKEFNDGFQDGLFASTPALEALKMLLSDDATVENAGAKGQKVVMIKDVARAFFEAPARRPICVELPPEEQAQPGRVGNFR